MINAMIRVTILLFLGLGTAQGQTSPGTYEPVGRGARLFVAKCFPGHGRLSEQDFRQIADAGFTVAVDNWKEDMPTFCARAARAGLDVMEWQMGMASTDKPAEQTVTRLGKHTKFFIPSHPQGWKIITDELVEQAKLSLVHRNLKGANLDFEIYDPNQTDGYCESYDDRTFSQFLESMGHQVPTPLTPPEQRYEHLKKLGLLGMFVDYQYKLVAQQVKELRKKVDAINPRFQIGVYGWGVLVEAVMENVATAKAPVLCLNAMTYGRTIYSNAFQGGYDANEPDRRGLKWSLTINYRLACDVRNKDYPAVFLGGHYPQSPGPKDGSQYKFTVRQAFNSAAYGDGYWIWTDWFVPEPWKSKEAWIAAMMEYFGKANAALDHHDYTWSSREPEQVVDSKGTKPGRIVTGNGKASLVWDAISGKQIRQEEKPIPSSPTATLDGKTLRVNGLNVELLDKDDRLVKVFPAGHGVTGIAVGDVDGVPGPEVITLNAGWVKTWDPDSGALLLQFPVGRDQKDIQIREQ